MVKYLNDYHRENSERAMEYLRKQKPLSPEEAEAQTRAIHKLINQREQQSKNNK